MDILRLVGGEKLINKFRSSCFGHLTDWKPGYKCLPALRHVASRLIDTTDGELWFFLRGRRVNFSPRDFALITGLNFGRSNFDPASDHDLSGVIAYRSFCSGQMTVTNLIERVTDKNNVIQDDDGSLYLRAVLVCVAHTMILGSDRAMDGWVWALVDDLQTFHEFPWGAYAYKLFHHHMTNGGKGKKWHLYGPSWALMIWALEVIPGLGDEVAKRVDGPSIHPRCLRWNFKARPKTKDIDLQPFYETKGDLIEMNPDSYEITKSYWVTASGSHPLDVSFTAPHNPVKNGGKRQAESTLIVLSDDDEEEEDGDGLEVGLPGAQEAGVDAVDVGRQEVETNICYLNRQPLISWSVSGKRTRPASSSRGNAATESHLTSHDRQWIERTVKESEARIQTSIERTVKESEIQIKRSIHESEGRIIKFMENLIKSEFKKLKGGSSLSGLENDASQHRMPPPRPGPAHDNRDDHTLPGSDTNFDGSAIPVPFPEEPPQHSLQLTTHVFVRDQQIDLNQPADPSCCSW